MCFVYKLLYYRCQEAVRTRASCLRPWTANSARAPSCTPCRRTRRPQWAWSTSLRTAQLKVFPTRGPGPCLRPPHLCLCRCALGSMACRRPHSGIPRPWVGAGATGVTKSNSRVTPPPLSVTIVVISTVLSNTLLRLTTALRVHINT